MDFAPLLTPNDSKLNVLVDEFKNLEIETFDIAINQLIEHCDHILAISAKHVKQRAALCEILMVCCSKQLYNLNLLMAIYGSLLMLFADLGEESAQICVTFAHKVLDLHHPIRIPQISNETIYSHKIKANHFPYNSIAPADKSYPKDKADEIYSDSVKLGLLRHIQNYLSRLSDSTLCSYMMFVDRTIDLNIHLCEKFDNPLLSQYHSRFLERRLKHSEPICLVIVDGIRFLIPRFPAECKFLIQKLNEKGKIMCSSALILATKYILDNK